MIEKINWIKEIIKPRCITNFATVAVFLYDNRPCQNINLIIFLNFVVEKSAAKLACRPSLPTIPIPTSAS